MVVDLGRSFHLKSQRSQLILLSLKRRPTVLIVIRNAIMNNINASILVMISYDICNDFSSHVWAYKSHSGLNTYTPHSLHKKSSGLPSQHLLGVLIYGCGQTFNGVPCSVFRFHKVGATLNARHVQLLPLYHITM